MLQGQTKGAHSLLQIGPGRVDVRDNEKGGYGRQTLRITANSSSRRWAGDMDGSVLNSAEANHEILIVCLRSST